MSNTPSNADTHKQLLQNPSTNSLINVFRNLGGFQRSNKFWVDITPPNSLKAKWGNNVPRLFATSVQIPSQVINYYQDTVSPSGPYIDIPVKREYDERFIIDFIVDKNWECRRFFDDWMELMFISNPAATSTSPSGGSMIRKNSVIINFWSNILGQMDIYALGNSSGSVANQEAVNRQISLKDVWPGTILPTQMMYDTPNDYLTLSVDINYRYYEIYNSEGN